MLGERLALARKKKGLSQRQLGAAMGERYDQTMISRVENGRSGLVGEGLTKAAMVLGVSIDYLFGLTDDPTPAGQLVRTNEQLEPESHDLIWVPKVAAIVGRGEETGQYDATIVKWVPFSREWLCERGVHPDNCHLVDVQGDRMDPSVPDGCSIFVNLDVREYKDDTVFLLRFKQQIIERTLQYLTPVRLVLDRGVYNGAPYEDWYLSFDKDKSLRWPLSLYEVQDIIGEVPAAVTSP